MIDNRFDLAAFERLQGDRVALREKADLLQDEITREIHSHVQLALDAIIERLQRMGHDLRPYGPQRPEHIGFRDDVEDETGYDCKLRVACDFFISAGYADVLYSKSNPEGLPLR